MSFAQPFKISLVPTTGDGGTGSHQKTHSSELIREQLACVPNQCTGRAFAKSRDAVGEEQSMNGEIKSIWIKEVERGKRPAPLERGQAVASNRD